ncbi:MAG: glycosyltransferase family 4 protein [Phycisphaerales bacterium]|nr:glycosyltransferase family 4 protein [Phycisphaerales bacterium]
MTTTVTRQRTDAVAGGERVASPEGNGFATERATLVHPMHILMAAPQPIFEPRGTPLSVVYRIRALCRAGHRVDLLTYPYGRDVRIDGLRIIRVPRVPGVSGVGIGPSGAKLALDGMMAVRLCALMAARRYDCIWSHEEAGLFCGVASRVTGVPHVYDMHSDLSQQIKNYGRYATAPIVWAFDALTRSMIHLADVVLTICDDLVKTIASIAPGKRALLVENYCTEVDFLDDDVPSADELRARHRLDDRVTALYVGSLEPYQGIEILIGAAAALQQRKVPCRMLIVGGRPAQVNRLRAEVLERGIGETVELAGSVPPAAVNAYIDVADMLLTSRSMGTNVPLKLYSYMKSGKPIVATNIFSHTQLLDDRTAVLADPDGESFAEGIGRMVGDASLRRRLASNARAKADAFSNESFDLRIEQALRWVSELNQRRRGSCAGS